VRVAEVTGVTDPRKLLTIVMCARPSGDCDALVAESVAVLETLERSHLTCTHSLALVGPNRPVVVHENGYTKRM
jgi:hypothetical protein